MEYHAGEPLDWAKEVLVITMEKAGLAAAKLMHQAKL
jgi:hypothetical protein